MELTKTKFKQTELGLIPDDWEFKKVGDCFEICNNLRLPISQEIRNSMQGIYPYYGPTKIQDYINEYRVEGEYALIGEDGDHFLKWYTHSMTQLATGKFNVNNHAHLVKGNKKDTTTIWFYYFFKNRDITKFLTRQGAGRYKISKAGLINLPCLYPKIEEQKAIAQVLRDTDNLIQAIEQKLAKKRAIKQGAMQQLLTPKEDWEVKKLTEIVNYIHGKAHENYIVEDGKYIAVNSKFISTEGKVSKRSNHNFCEARKGDVLTVLSDLPNGKALAKCFYVSEDKKYAVNQRICIWRSKSAIPLFLFYLLNRNKYFLKLDDGVTQTHILNHHIEKCEISIPNSTEEQTRIATILSDMDAEIIQLEKKLAKYKMLKQGLMQNLLTGKIRLV